MTMIKKLKSMVAAKDAQVEALNGRIEVLMDDLVEARADRKRYADARRAGYGLMLASAPKQPPP